MACGYFANTGFGKVRMRNIQMLCVFMIKKIFSVPALFTPSCVLASDPSGLLPIFYGVFLIVTLILSFLVFIITKFVKNYHARILIRITVISFFVAPTENITEVWWPNGIALMFWPSDFDYLQASISSLFVAVPLLLISLAVRKNAESP